MMLKKIEEQTKTIEYIKKMYKQKTGEEVVMPMSWQDYLCLEQADVPSQALPVLEQEDQQVMDFRTVLDSLNLPTRINASKTPLTSFSPTNKFHMVEHIDLSGFKDMGFSKVLLREFLSRICEMRALHSLSLKGNGIDENCAEEVEALLQIKRISRVDLSSNKMGKSCLQIISKNFGHLEWVDLSRNYFLFEVYSLQNLMNAIRLNGKIWHICLDLQDPKLLNLLCSYMKIKPQLHSLGVIDSNIDQDSMGIICKVLEESSMASKKQKEVRINYLNFSFCYLTRPVFNTLLKAVSLNNTLISLNLSNNNLGEFMGIAFCKTLEGNISLVRVDLAGNLLEDNFAKALAQCLEKNQIIQFVEISKNNIGQQGAKCLFEILSTKNDTLESLGNFQTNARMGQQLLQKIRKALKINKVSKEIRSKIMSEEAELSPVEISNRQTEAYLEAQYQDYDLLTPIAVSNPLRDDPNQVHIWKFQ